MPEELKPARIEKCGVLAMVADLCVRSGVPLRTSAVGDVGNTAPLRKVARSIAMVMVGKRKAEGVLSASALLT